MCRALLHRRSAGLAVGDQGRDALPSGARRRVHPADADVDPTVLRDLRAGEETRTR